MKKSFLLFVSFVDAGLAADPAPPEIPLPQMRSVDLPALKLEKAPTELRMKKLPDPVAKPAPQSPSKTKEVNGLLDLLGGEENLRIALAPDRIEVCRIAAKKASPTAASQTVEESAVVLSAPDAKLIREIVTNDASYNWDEDRDCNAVYDVRLKFWRSQECLRVDVSFGCAMLRVDRGEAEAAVKNVDFGVKSLAGILDHYVPGVISKVTTSAAEPTARPAN